MIRRLLLFVFVLGSLTAVRAEFLWSPVADPKQDALDFVSDNAVVTNGDGRSPRELSHREWLTVALMRADFKLAARHAQFIVNATPNDIRANFALGMAAYFDGRYDRAEMHLLRCVRNGSGDPAILNNLALSELHLGKTKEALKYIEAALKRYPNIPELQKTRDKVLAKIKTVESRGSNSADSADQSTGGS